MPLCACRHREAPWGGHQRGSQGLGGPVQGGAGGRHRRAAHLPAAGMWGQGPLCSWGLCGCSAGMCSCWILLLLPRVQMLLQHYLETPASCTAAVAFPGPACPPSSGLPASHLLALLPGILPCCSRAAWTQCSQKRRWKRGRWMPCGKSWTARHRRCAACWLGSSGCLWCTRLPVLLSALTRVGLLLPLPSGWRRRCAAAAMAVQGVHATFPLVHAAAAVPKARRLPGYLAVYRPDPASPSADAQTAAGGAGGPLGPPGGRRAGRQHCRRARLPCQLP